MPSATQAILPRQESATVQAWAEVWLEQKKHQVKESTCAMYAYMWQHYLKPTFAACAPEEVTEAKISAFVHDNPALSPLTISGSLAILHAILKTSGNLPATRMPTAVPPHGERKPQLISAKTWEQLQQCLLEDDCTTSTSIALALFMGLRIGEICALQRQDVQLDRRLLLVRKTVHRAGTLSGETKTRLFINRPMTEASYRQVPIPDALLARLQGLCLSKGSEDYLFGIRGKALDPRTLQYRSKKYFLRHGLPGIRFSQLRHQFAQNCAKKDMEMSVLSEILGHATPRTTATYYKKPSMENKREQMNQCSGL